MYLSDYYDSVACITNFYLLHNRQYEQNTCAFGFFFFFLFLVSVVGLLVLLFTETEEEEKERELHSVQLSCKSFRRCGQQPKATHTVHFRWWSRRDAVHVLVHEVEQSAQAKSARVTAELYLVNQVAYIRSLSNHCHRSYDLHYTIVFRSHPNGVFGARSIASSDFIVSFCQNVSWKLHYFYCLKLFPRTECLPCSQRALLFKLVSMGSVLIAKDVSKNNNSRV